MSRQLKLFPELDWESGESSHGPSGRPTRPATDRLRTATASPAMPDRVRGQDTEDILRHKLSTWLDEPIVSLVLTDNRRRIISAQSTELGLAVRMHRCFAWADEDTLRTVADFLSGRKGDTQRKRALQSIRGYFERHRDPRGDGRRLTLRPKGHFFNLEVLRDHVNAEYFGGALDVHITWGRAPRVRRRRRRGFSILLGSYTEADRLVRIHPCLDRYDVPEYVIESVVYHEMLHAALPAETRHGRRCLHTPEFRRREQLYRHHDAANRWLEANLARLAASR